MTLCKFRRLAFVYSLALAGIILDGCAEKKESSKEMKKEEPKIVLPSFTITEHFGVSHPDQVITFDLPPGIPTSGVRVVDGSGKPALFQFVEGGKRLAVRTDLPANASRTWKMEVEPEAAKAPATHMSMPQACRFKEDAASYEITNDITGIRIPKAVPVSPQNQALPAPVQGVLMRDGTWAGSGGRPNPLTYQSSSDWTKKTAATGMIVEFLERGPLITKARIKYSFTTPDYVYGQQKTRSAGPGHYTCTITIEAGQPSVLFDEETDVEPSWSLDFYKAVHPTNARYRGHHSSAPEAGYEPGGGVYRASHERPGLDAQVDFKYDKARSSGYVTTPDTWRWMCVWDPWCFDSGWYWQAYDANADEKSNLLGIFAGPASKALGAGFSAVGFWTAPEKEGACGFGITMQSYRRSASAQLFPKTRFSWGLFVGTKADLLPPDKIQPINLQMNLHGGINLDKVHRWTLDFPDPPGGYGGAFMPVEAVAKVKQKAREDQEYFKWLYNADPYSRPLFDAWTDKTMAKRDAAVAQVAKEAHDMLDKLVNAGGIYDTSVHFWHGGLTAQRYGVWIDQLLAEPGLPDAQRKQLKAAAVMFANIVWDDDHAPISTADHGLNLGTENMPIQQWGYRRFYALFMARHPTMKERSRQVVEGLRQTVEQQINDSGAHIGCTHYIGASFAPTLNTLLQVKQLGELDPFAKWPKLAKFADFYMNFLTPPEVRAGGKRCFISVGDSGLEPSEIYGVLGTGFRDADKELSAKLMGAWKDGGKPHSFFFGSTVFMIDEDLQSADPGLKDASFPGYYSVMRNAWGTPDETALWVINGDHYRDHRSFDHGSIILYALGKPLSADWSAIYTPHTPGSYVHSMVVPESAIGHVWDKNGASIAAGAGWGKSKQESFESTLARATSVSSFERDKLKWRRTAAVDRSDPARPAIFVRDNFEGADAAVPKVASFYLMAVGPVQTPEGELNPPGHTHPNAAAKPEQPESELPSALPPMDLPAGVHRFGFTGRYDVDFDVYVIAEKPVKALLGNWAVSAWGGHITEREERQHILRVRGEGPFVTLIVPWRRNEKPEGLKAEVRDGQLHLVSSKGDLAFPLKDK